MNQTIKRRTIPATLLLVATLPAAASSELATEADAAMTRLIHASCEVGEVQAATDEVVRFATELEPELARLLTDGPLPEQLADRRAILERQWERRKRFLATDPALGLEPEDRWVARSATREGFVQRGLERFVGQCEERAVFGLAAIRTPTAARVLELWAIDVDDARRELVEAAVLRFDPRAVHSYLD